MKSTSPEADPACTDPNALRRARIALAAICEPGEAGLADVVDSTGPTATVAALLDADRQRPKIPRADALRRRLEELDLDALIDRGREIGARVVVPGDGQWPGRMNELRAHRPLALWCWGEADPRLMALRSVAIVGARACTRYGEWIAREWSAQLAKDDVTVISGGAYGIDAAAHRGALTVDGVTICVLAGGVDTPYPRGNEGLFAEIVDRGLLVSEAPPGETVRRRRFLTRNRLIAALASATCVVEAAHRSGSVTTASNAAELNRPVLAVPGPVTSEMSRGTHRLVHEGVAMLAADVTDVRAVLPDFERAHGASPHDSRSRSRGHATHDQSAVRSDERPISRVLQEVLDAVPTPRRSAEGMSVDDIAVRSGVSASQARTCLAQADEMGLVQQRGQDRWVYAPSDGAHGRA
ncbi:MAG: DNA-processing protein DprA [Actinomycetota bacterium]